MGDEADEANDGNRENAKRASERPTRALIALTLFSALGGFLFGYDTGVMSGAMLLIRKEFKLTTLWQELIVSVAVVAAWFGSLVGGPCADYFGRRKWIMFSSAIFVIGSVTLGAAPTKEALLVGRIIVGLGIGASSMCIPVYISEVAPLSHRGHLTVINSIFLTGGQFVASVVSGLFSGVDKGWRWILGLGAAPAVVQFIAFIFSAESPRWLLLNGRTEETRKVLKKYRPINSDIEKEIQELQTAKDEKVSLGAIISCDPVRRALVIGCLLQFYQQLAGINTVMYYSASIIAMAGIDDDQTAIWLSALTSFFNFSFTFVGLWFVERVGRRPLTLGSLLGVIFSLLILALSFHLTFIHSSPVTHLGSDPYCSQFKECSSCTRDSDCGFCFSEISDNSTCLKSNHSAYDEVSSSGLCSNADDSESKFAYDFCPSDFGWVPILGLCLYLCFFACGMGPMPWSINSEIYPGWARARCNSIATSVNWAVNLFVSLTFLSLAEAITKHGTFYLYVGFATSGFIIFFLLLPETRGVKLEEVESTFAKPLCRSTPWKKAKTNEGLINRQESCESLS